MKYNQYSFETIKKLINIGKKYANKYNDINELIYNTDYDNSQLEFIAIGFENPDFEPEIKEFYRIGEPITNEYGCYKPSYNFAEERYENGVSVVTTAWLCSMKSVFFNTTDEKIAKVGVYKLTGFALPSVGGDDELLIMPLDWAEKTRIRTRAGLEKVVKKVGM